MGRYLSVAVANKIYVEKDGKEQQEILNKLKDSIDLDIYNILYDEDRFLCLEIKKDVFHNNIIDLMRQVSSFCSGYSKKYLDDKIEELDGKSYEDMMQIGKEKVEVGFAYIKGGLFSNDISYITNDLYVFCDAIELIDDGKIIMECYNGIFNFLRNNIIANIHNNPLKTSLVVAITG